MKLKQFGFEFTNIVGGGGFETQEVENEHEIVQPCAFKTIGVIGWVQGNVSGKRSQIHCSTERQRKMKKMPLFAGLKKLRTIMLMADDEILGGRFNELFLGGLRMTDNTDDDGEDDTIGSVRVLSEKNSMNKAYLIATSFAYETRDNANVVIERRVLHR